MNKEQMIALARQEATKHGLRPELFLGQLEQESQWNPSAKSGAGAMGVAQFMPGTARDFGINPMDPAQAIPAAAKYMSQLMNRFRSEKMALQAYNWGMGNMDAWIKTGKGAKGQAMPKEASDYAPVIFGRARKYGADLAPADVGTALAAAPAPAGAKTGVPALPMNTPAGPRLTIPSTSEEADLFAGLGQYPEHVQAGMANLLGQLLPARDMLDGRDMLAGGGDLTPSLPSDYDQLIGEIIDKA